MVNVFQSNLMVDFLYPFLLMFFIVFAVLEKTKVLGGDNKQLNALVSLVIGLIFVGAIFPKIFVGNMILYLSVALVVVFISLMFWGFLTGTKPLGWTVDEGKKIHKVFFFAFIISFVVAVIWAGGFWNKFVSGLSKVFDFLFKSSWSSSFWGNALMVVIVLVVVLVVLGVNPFKDSSAFIKLK